MKKTYNTPSIEKVQFNFKERIAKSACGCTCGKAGKGSCSCNTRSV